MSLLKSPRIILTLITLTFAFLSISVFLVIFPSKPILAADCQVQANSTVEIGKDLKVEVKNTAPVNYTVYVYTGQYHYSMPTIPPIYTQTKQGVTPGLSLFFTIPSNVFLQNEPNYTVYAKNEGSGNYCDPTSGTYVHLITPTSGQNPCGSTGTECETALGRIPTDPGAFVGRILSIAMGLAGGIALILMVIGSIRVLTSSGDQQRLAGGRDMIISAIAGLLFLIFSFLILEFIGANILGLGFGGFSAP